VRSDPGAAAAEYKQLLAQVTETAARLREDDRRRATEIGRTLIGLEDDMERAGLRARLTTAVVQLHWERALDLLWTESWLKLRPRPGPDRRVDPALLDQFDAEVAARAEALGDVVRRRWYQLPGR
jgi:hypothetical protein